MQQYRKNLGKVSLTSEGVWSRKTSYEILSIVYDEHTQRGFISRQNVPQGIDLYNKEYWMPFNVSGYADNNMIILADKVNEHSIKSYTLEEAILSIAQVGRRPGAILGFYNENNDRLDIGGRWELWQFNDTNVYNWENVDSWQNLYYNYNKFMGWFKDENFLTKYAPFPEIGCYAFVGSEFNEATVYRCDNKYVWNNTTQHAWDYVKVIVDGNVTVGKNGNWFNNGEDSGIPASVKGENGKTPIFREKDNTIQYSFDNVNWITISGKVAAWFRWNATTGDTQANNVGRIQISRDNVTWTNLSGDIINNLHISRYIGTDETLPTSGIAEGTIYAKGPTYADGDTSHDNPIYRLWVYAWKGNTLAWQDNGEFTSIAAGVVQETGDSETKVMSQKAVSTKLSELGSELNGRIVYAEHATGNILADNLNIEANTELKVIVNNNSRTYSYFSVVIVEGGEPKTIAGGITQQGGIYSIDYISESLITRVVVNYTGIVNNDYATLEIVNKKNLSFKLDNLNNDVASINTKLGILYTKEYKSISKNIAVDLVISKGKNVTFVVNNKNSKYYYFSIIVVEDGEAKTITEAITQQGGIYKHPYIAQGNISRIVIAYNTINFDDGVIFTIEDNNGIEQMLEKTNDLIKDKGKFAEDTGGIKELYFFDNSIEINTLHLVYNGGTTNLYKIVFFSGDNKIAETEDRTSATNDIIKIFKSDTIGSTDVIVGYIIVDWGAFKIGTTAVVKNITNNCYNKDISPRIYNYIQMMKLNGIEKDVWKPIKREMFDNLESLKTTLNDAFVDYAKLCKCSHYSFYSYEGIPAQLKYILPSINLNFRRKVIEETMTPQEMATAINYALTVPIERFNDAKLYNVSKETDMGWSINTGMPVGEPSAIVSDDGSTLYVYCGCLYRYKTTDGINYVKDADITLDGRHRPMGSEGYLMHCNVNYIDGVYYLIGTHDNYHPLVLWTSTDGVNFITQGTLLNIGEEFNSKGQTIGNFGNTYLVKDSGKWYLYYEITYTGCKDWSNCLATCWNILEKEEDGTLGKWTQIPKNPIQDAANTFPLQSTRGYGNIDFARGENNLPIKHNGKYYMYYHGNANRGSLIFRGYSTDLINWTEESMLYNNRDIPTAGATAPGNADHTIIQFKGRTLLFYTYDINDPNNEPVVKLMIDDRPIRELLSLMP